MNPLECFVEEIRSTAGVWTVYGARFSPREPDDARPLAFDLTKTRGKSVPWRTLMRLCRTSDRWSFRWVGAHRRGWPRFVDAPGWSVLAWCYVIADDAEPELPPFNLGVQIYSRGRVVRRGPVLARIRRALRDELDPLGFREMRPVPPQSFVMVEKDAATRAIAKRERSRLDRVIFADRKISNIRRSSARR